MRVAVDARLPEGDFGGVQQTILGLADGLARLENHDDDEYLFLVRRHHEWLSQVLRPPCRAVVVDQVSARGGRAVERLGQRSPTAGQVAGHLVEGRGRVLPPQPAAVGAANVDLVHFMLQRGFRTRLPNVYQPHDLQHVHLPEHFHPLNRAYRARSYRQMAAQASRVAVMTTSGRADVVRHLGARPEAVVVVPWASVRTLGPPDPTAGARADRLGLPPRYLLFPAQTRPHKNHVRLVRALGRLRREGLETPLVLTGRNGAAWPAVVAAIREEGVSDLVRPLGYVDEGLLSEIYRRAVALVFPSLYEGWGLPLLEAFEVGLPVLCSDRPPLREIAGDAAMLVDPEDVGALAAALRTLWGEELRWRLAAAGQRRATAFSWVRTAATFRAVYRDVLGAATPEDRALLAAPPLV